MEEKQIEKKTTVKEMAEQVGEKTNIELLKPVISRARARVKKIHELSRANHTKIMRGKTSIWYTEPPKMFISGLTSEINRNKAVITYNKYITDGENKKLFLEKAMVDDGTGKKVEKVYSASYKFEELIVETIEYGKPLKVERIKGE